MNKKMIEFEKWFFSKFVFSLMIVLSVSLIIYQKSNRIGNHVDWSNYTNFFLLTIFSFSSLVFFMVLFIASLGGFED